MRRRIGIVISVAILAFGFAVFVKGCGGGGSSAECNDGVVEGNEDCDGADLAGESCTSLGYGAGTLSCNANCTFNESACYTCGNNTAEGPEECDGADLGGTTCQDRGYDSGTLGCTGGCTFDESNCQSAATCGNNTQEGTEECDGNDLNSQTCETQGMGAGDLACIAAGQANECTFDTSLCGVPSLNTCVNAGGHSIPAAGTVTCYDDVNEMQWDVYQMAVQAGDCVDIYIDNGAGDADLRALAIDADQTHAYGLAEDYSQLDDEWACTNTPWFQGSGCPSRGVEALTAGQFTIAISQWAGNGTTPGVDTCNTGLSEYTLFVALNGTDASPVLMGDNQVLQ